MCLAITRDGGILLAVTRHGGFLLAVTRHGGICLADPVTRSFRGIVVVWRGCNMAVNFRREAVLRFSAVTPSAVTPSAVTGIVNYGGNSRRYLDRPITAGNHVDNIPEEHLDIPSILRKTKASTVFRTNTQAPQSITLLPSSDKAFIDSADTARQAKLLSDSLLSMLSPQGLSCSS